MGKIQEAIEKIVQNSQENLDQAQVELQNAHKAWKKTIDSLDNQLTRCQLLEQSQTLAKRCEKQLKEEVESLPLKMKFDKETSDTLIKQQRKELGEAMKLLTTERQNFQQQLDQLNTDNQTLQQALDEANHAKAEIEQQFDNERWEFQRQLQAANAAKEDFERQLQDAAELLNSDIDQQQEAAEQKRNPPLRRESFGQQSFYAPINGSRTITSDPVHPETQREITLYDALVNELKNSITDLMAQMEIRNASSARRILSGAQWRLQEVEQRRSIVCHMLPAFELKKHTMTYSRIRDQISSLQYDLETLEKDI